MRAEQRKRLIVSCQSGSKCTIQATAYHLINVAASEDQEKSAGKVKRVSPEVSNKGIAKPEQTHFRLTFKVDQLFSF